MNLKTMASTFLLSTFVMGGMTTEALTLTESTTPSYSKWAESQVTYADENGLTVDSLGNNYTVDITRGQIADLLVNMIEKSSGETLPEADKNTFTDANVSSVLKAFEAGIILGKTTTTFQPDSTATRQEIAIMIVRAIEKLEELTGESFIDHSLTSLEGYSDFENTSNWAKDFVAILANNNIMNGSDNKLNPLSATSIQECLILNNNLFKLGESDTSDEEMREDVEEYILLDWKEAYTQYLAEIETYYSGHPNLELRPHEENTVSSNVSYSYPVDLSQTTYWLHDMDLDGIPELFLGFYYPSRGFIDNRHDSSDKVEATGIEIYALFGEEWRDFGFGSQLTFENSTGNGFSKDYLAIPPDGIGFYYQLEDTSYSGTWGLSTKGAEGIEYMDYWVDGWMDSDYHPPLLEGTPIPDTSTWTHYTDLSGLGWNG